MNITKPIEEFLQNKVKFRFEHDIKIDGSVEHSLYAVLEKFPRPSELIKMDIDLSAFSTDLAGLLAVDASSALVDSLISQVNTEVNLNKIRNFRIDV